MNGGRVGKELLVSTHGVVLVTYRPEGTDIVCRQRSDERRVKNNWRNLTYVPEISDRKHRVRYTYLSPGPVPNSILFCWLFTMKEQREKVRFQQKHNQGLSPLFLTVS